MSKKDLNDKLSQLEKNFGLKRASSQKNVEFIRTGIYSLDYVLDGGLQLVEGGHKIEFYGKESSGKTTFAQKVVAKYQKLDKVCVWVVSESFHKDWAKKLGVNTDKLLLSYPDSVEDATETILKIVPEVDLIVVDSVASLIPEVEIEKSMHEQTRGVQAKAYSQFCRKLYKKILNQKVSLIFINQLREKMGVLYGNPEITPCGRALKHMYDCLGADTIIYNGKKFIPLKYLKSKVTSYNFKHKKFQNNKLLQKKAQKFKNYLELDLGITRIDASENHKFYNISSDGTLQLKRVKNLKKGDMLLLSKGKNFKIKNPSFTDNKFVRLLGYYVGDGYKINKENHIIIADKNRNFLKYYQDLLKEKSFKINKSRNTNLLHIKTKFSNHLFETIRQYKLDVKASKKKLPFLFYNFSDNCLKDFIAGFYDAEGNDNTNLPTFHSSSEKLLRNIQFMLWRLGIRSNINKRKSQSLKKLRNDKKYYTMYALYVSDSKSIIKFKRVIPTLKNIKLPKYNSKMQYNFVELIKEYHNILLKRKEISRYLGRNNSLQHLIKQKTISLDRLKNIYSKTKNLSFLNEQNTKYERILKLKQNFDFVKIKKITKKATNFKYLGFKKKLIDIQVENDENFIANGILSHNSRIEFRTKKPIEVGTKNKKERIGTEIHLYAKKNKLGKPQRKIITDFYFDGTIDNAKSLLHAGIKYDVIDFSGKTYKFEDVKAVGKVNFIEAMTEKEWKKVEKEIWRRIK